MEKIKDKGWECAELRAVVGEEKWHEILANVGGMRIQIPVPSEESVIYYWRQGKSVNEIAYCLRMSYSRVSEIVKKYQEKKRL